MDDIIKSTSELAYDIGEATETSWSPPANMTYEQWERVGNTLQQLGRSVNWWLGDWMNTGERKWGDTYTQAVNATDASIESLKKYKAVAERVEADIRFSSLTWTHHFYVAYLPEDHRWVCLKIADAYGLSTRDFQKQVTNAPDDVRQRMVDAVLAVGPQQNLRDYMPFDQLVEYGWTKHEQESAAETPTEPEVVEEDSVEVDGTEYRYKTDSGEPVLDFWEARGTPLRYATEAYAEWDGLSVMAIINSDGEAQLLWNLGVSDD